MTSKLAFPSSLLSALLPAVASVVLAGATPAHAQPAPSDVPEDPYDDSEDLAPPDQSQPVTPDEAQAPAPATQPPVEQPPPPPEAPPAVQQQVQPVQPVPAQAAPATGGQWVYTQQYGWVWEPYGNQYVYTPEDVSGSAYPYAYVYYPAYGWTWLSAPWVWGWGPHVYFSLGRPWYYGWYHHPHYVGGYLGHGFVRGFRGPVYRGGYVHGYRAPVYRGGFRGGVGHIGGGFHGFSGHVSGGHFSGHVGGHFGGHVGGHGHH